MDEVMASRPVTARSRARLRGASIRRPSTSTGIPAATSPARSTLPSAFFERQELQRRRFDYGMRMPFLVSQPPTYGAGLVPSGVYTMIPPELIQTKKQVQSRMLSDPKLANSGTRPSGGVRERRKSRELHILEEATMRHEGFKHVAKEIERNRQKYRLKWRMPRRQAVSLAVEDTWREEYKAGCSYWVNDRTGEVRTSTPKDSEDEQKPLKKTERRRSSLGGSDYSELIQALDEAFETTTGTSQRLNNQNDADEEFCLGTGSLTYDPRPWNDLRAHLDHDHAGGS